MLEHTQREFNVQLISSFDFDCCSSSDENELHKTKVNNSTVTFLLEITCSIIPRKAVEL